MTTLQFAERAAIVAATVCVVVLCTFAAAQRVVFNVIGCCQ